MQARIRLLLAIGIALLIPAAAAFAATNPLVPCNGISCQACDLAALAQNIIKFALLLAIPIAAGMFAWAGALYITARGDTGQISRATKIFGSVALGFVLALSGWLVVNTILYVVIADKSQFADSNWFTIKCVPESSRPMNKTLKDLSDLLQLTPVQPLKECPSEGATKTGTGVCKKTGGSYERAIGYSCPADMPLFSDMSGICGNADGSKTGPPVPDEYLASDCPTGTSPAGTGICKKADGTYQYAPGYRCPADMPNFSVTSGICGNDDGSKTGPPVKDAGVGSESDKTNREILNGVGISVNKAYPMTSLAGMRPDTLNVIMAFKQACGGVDCDVVVTGGTEPGHAGGTYSHGGGYKFDLRITPSVNDYIERNFTSIGTRTGDGSGPAYKDPCGNIYVRESNHWDAVVYSSCDY